MGAHIDHRYCLRFLVCVVYSLAQRVPWLCATPGCQALPRIRLRAVRELAGLAVAPISSGRVQATQKVASKAEEGRTRLHLRLTVALPLRQANALLDSLARTAPGIVGPVKFAEPEAATVTCYL